MEHQVLHLEVLLFLVQLHQLEEEVLLNLIHHFQILETGALEQVLYKQEVLEQEMLVVFHLQKVILVILEKISQRLFVEEEVEELLQQVHQVYLVDQLQEEQVQQIVFQDHQ